MTLAALSATMADLPLDVARLERASATAHERQAVSQRLIQRSVHLLRLEESLATAEVALGASRTIRAEPAERSSGADAN